MTHQFCVMKRCADGLVGFRHKTDLKDIEFHIPNIKFWGHNIANPGPIILTPVRDYQQAAPKTHHTACLKLSVFQGQSCLLSLDIGILPSVYASEGFTV